MPHASHKDIFSYLTYLIAPGLRGFFLFFLVTFAFLLYLGTWQVNRLEWKNELIKNIKLNLTKPSIPLDDLLLEILPHNKSPDYRQVHFSGKFDTTKPFKLMMQMHKTPKGDTLGYHLIVPFLLETGARVLVNTGWIPQKIDPKEIPLPKGKLTLTGITKTKTGRSSYTPDNNFETHELFSLDPLELSHEKAWPTLLPFFVTLTTPLPLIDQYPLPGDGKISIRNTHLEYALTWYLLALFWLLIFVVYARHKIHQPESNKRTPKRRK